MAKAVLTMQDSLSCPICLDLLKDPVAIPCGHSYCLSCIKSFWDKEDHGGMYSCPQCRQIFTPRPVLNKNTILAELAEGLRKTRVHNAPPAVSNTGPGDVECDICSGTKRKAVKSCLVCLASYCKTHIQTHYESAALKRHKLVEASSDLQQKICTNHDKLLEIFCRTDQQFICYLCVMDEHSGHKTVSAAAERTERQKQIFETMRDYQQMIQRKEMELCELKLDMASLCLSAQAAIDENERLFTELIQSIEKSRSEASQLIRTQEQTGLDLCEKLLKKLEQEISDLRKRNTELEQLSNTDDHISFLQSCQSLCVPLEFTALPSPTIKPKLFSHELTTAMSGIKHQVEKFYEIELIKSGASTIWLPEPKTRDDFLKYSCQLTLDPNTAHQKLRLSDENRKATVTPQIQNYPHHSERFDKVQQVLCKERLCGRHYWEVEQPFKHNFTIAVAYKDIHRKEDSNEPKFGCNDQSWSLSCFNSRYSFSHNNNEIDVPVEACSSKIGVYLDHPAGTLSFYSISDTMNLIHKVQTTFTQPLYAGFQIYIYDNFIQICDLNQ
ncbi:tripartite motif-containing protein 16-like [Trichomycterus rosablanca]|uniref:tripartite motif-containing protein 16-like n=1 Tax=Trichomycterus rosablanca TaxID=2290929 RepID=UPI002F35ADDC